MDALVCGSFVLRKADQPSVTMATAEEAFGLD
jgi:hypothetical protein